MSSTGVFIQLRGSYTYIFYEKSYEDVHAAKDELTARLKEMFSKKISPEEIRIEYFDTGLWIHSFRAEKPVLYATKETVCVYRQGRSYDLHPNPYGAECASIPYALHTFSDQMKYVRVFEKIRDRVYTSKEEFMADVESLVEEDDE